jgi:hypothetical protein
LRLPPFKKRAPPRETARRIHPSEKPPCFGGYPQFCSFVFLQMLLDIWLLFEAGFSGQPALL